VAEPTGGPERSGAPGSESGAPEEPAVRPETRPPEPPDPLDHPVPWRLAIARAIAAAAAVAAGVLGLAVLTSLLPTEAQRVLFHAPVVVVALVVATAWLLWRVSRRAPGG
jgi:hypothetical protein